MKALAHGLVVIGCLSVASASALAAEKSGRSAAASVGRTGGLVRARQRFYEPPAEKQRQLPSAAGRAPLRYGRNGRGSARRGSTRGSARHFRVDLAKDAKPQADFGRSWSSRRRFLQLDGRNNALVSDVSGTDLRNFTVFVVGSPFSNAGMFGDFLAVNEREERLHHRHQRRPRPRRLGGNEQVNVEGRGFSGATC